jgi:hypothetical protein
MPEPLMRALAALVACTQFRHIPRRGRVGLGIRSAWDAPDGSGERMCDDEGQCSVLFRSLPMRGPRRVCFGWAVSDEAIGGAAFLALMAAGPLLIWLGARAAGAGVLASVVGGFLGMFAAPTMDDLARTVPIGATLALFVGGVAGLVWRSPAPRSTLVATGLVVAGLGIAGTLVIARVVPLDQVKLVGDTADPMTMLLPVDAGFVALLCAVQPVRPRPHPSSGRDSGHVGP